jgi:hypothetical protein
MTTKRSTTFTGASLQSTLSITHFNKIRSIKENYFLKINYDIIANLEVTVRILRYVTDSQIIPV